VAVRGNFCSVDEEGLLVDRRAGRIATEEAAGLCRLLSGFQLDGRDVLVAPVREHRFLAILRGAGLSPEVSDSDPQRVGVAPLSLEPLSPGAEVTARLANEFVAWARARLADVCPANMVLLRGFSQRPLLPSLAEVYRLKPAAIAVYAMYRGLAHLLGMDILATGATLKEQVATLERHYDQHDFFYLHVKGPDAAGEDGNFARNLGQQFFGLQGWASLLPLAAVAMALIAVFLRGSVVDPARRPRSNLA